MPTSLLSFLQSLPVPAAVKSIFLTSDKPGQHSLFLHLASALAPAFPAITNQQAQLLNAAVYLGATGIYQLDNVLDGQSEGQERARQTYHGQLLMLESQRLLSQLFTLHDSFWSTYYRRLEQHFGELTLSKHLTDLTIDSAYEQLLAHKYAMLYVPLDALFYLTGQANQTEYDLLQQSLQHFSKGYNLPNDVMGLAEDIALGINNYAYWRIRAFLLENDIDPTDYTYEQLQRLLYVSGVATTLLDESATCFHKADELVTPLRLPLYQNLVQQRLLNVAERKMIIMEQVSPLV